MVFFNYATMQMAAKIVYYGPGLCGKTTNLHMIYAKTSPQSRGEMVSLETETDRTLFFDLLPLDVGVVGGFKTRLQLYTVPGQVFYNTTRKLVLKGADGIVFVADSQKPMLEANVESLKNLRENLAEIGLDMDEIPLVIQLNKRDLPNILDKESLVKALDPNGKYEFVEASAVSGNGVFETLKVISKLTLKSLRRRMLGDEPAKAAPAKPAAPTPAAPAPPKPAAGTAVFTIHQSGAPARPVPPPAAQPAPPPVAAPPVQTETQQVAAVAAPPAEPAPVAEPAPAAAAVAAPPVESPAAEPAMPLRTVETPAPAAEAAVAEPEPEVRFDETEKTEKPVVVEKEVKHVKVRSSIDVLAELDSLRKKATSTSASRKVDVLSALDALTTKPKSGAVTKSVALSVPAEARSTKRVRVQITFEDDLGNVVQQSEQNIEIEKNDWSSLQLNLKIDPEKSS